jgi:membrane-associated phospholipid phosphatase
MAFFFWMTTLLAVSRNLRRQQPIMAAWGIFEIGAALALSVLVAFSREYLGYHSLTQVVAGATLGTVMAAVWHWLLTRVHARLCVLCDLSIVAAFGVKDTWHVDNALNVERQAFRASKNK